MYIVEADIKKIIDCDVKDPFAVLGMHQSALHGSRGVVIRAFIPNAISVKAIDENNEENLATLTSINKGGLFEVFFENRNFFSYLLEAEYEGGVKERYKDPYQFLPLLGDLDLHLFNEGTHSQLYDKLGSHSLTVGKDHGVLFAVWAPNARRVSVVGDFNYWDGRRHMMRVIGSSGVWEIFIPGIGSGEKYKFEIKTAKGLVLTKSDPHAFYCEVRPSTASIVFDIDAYEWEDKKWMNDRKAVNYLNEPLSVYELHLGSWKKNPECKNLFLTYRDAAPAIVEYVKKIGFTHIELMPIQEHPFDPSWGYQVTGNYAPTSRFGTPHDLMYFIDYCHQNDVGIIMDWVPAHFPKDAHSLAWFDGTSLYEHADPKQGEHSDWGTLIYNYGRNEVRSFLTSNAIFWCKKYHIDGLRVDAVASMLYLDYSRKPGEWIPNKYGGNENLEAIEFMRSLNEKIHKDFPEVLTIAEESTAWTGVSRPVYLGGLGFTLKWNMGWMNDTLEYFSKDPIHRKFHHQDLTFSMIYAFTENFILPISHDEVVHGKKALLDKMPGDIWQKFANLRLFLAYMYAHPGKKLLFMGSEIGQWSEWNHEESVNWSLLEHEPHKKTQEYMTELNSLYKNEKALWQVDFDWKGFEWLDYQDWENSIISFVRYGKDKSDYIIAVFNFTPVPRINYRIGVPENCFYKEILNSDSTSFFGSGVGNMGGVNSEPVSWGLRNFSLKLTLPPLAALYFKPVRSSE